MADDDVDLDLDLLRDSARDFLAERGEKESVADLAALDWTGLLVDERMGGAGWRPVETCVIAEELGRARDRSAWFGTTMAAAALMHAPDAVRECWLPAMLNGTATAGLALTGDVVRVFRGAEVDIVITLGRRGIHLFELSNGQQRRLDEDSMDVARAVCLVDIAAIQGVLIGFPRKGRSAACSREVARQRGLRRCRFDDIAAPHGISQGPHRFWCANRELSSGAAPSG